MRTQLIVLTVIGIILLPFWAMGIFFGFAGYCEGFSCSYIRMLIFFLGVIPYLVLFSEWFFSETKAYKQFTKIFSNLLQVILIIFLLVILYFVVFRGV